MATIFSTNIFENQYQKYFKNIAAVILICLFQTNFPQNKTVVLFALLYYGC